jgi:aquaporin Z
MSTSKLARLFAELVGTFTLAAVTIAVSKNYGNPLFTTISGAATLAALMSLLGPVSGGNFNPAITLGLFSVRKIKFVETILYVAMQAIGALLAWKLFEFLSPDRLVESVANEFDWKVFTAEMVGTLIFAMGFAGTIYRKFMGGHVGASVALSYFAGSAAVAVVVINRQLVTGFLNPALAIGVGYRPSSQSYLAYFFGPVIGAVLGMNLYKMFFANDKVEAVAVAPTSTNFKPLAPVAAVEKSVSKTASKPVAKTIAKKKPVAKKKPASRTKK